MYPRKKVDTDPVWKYEELPPADLIKSLHLEPAAIVQDEFSRADWFWSRRPKVLSESVSFFFFYLTVAVCLFYLLPNSGSRSSFSGSLQGRVALLSTAFVSTDGDMNTSQVLHASLTICRNENKALGYALPCPVCRCQRRGTITVRISVPMHKPFFDSCDQGQLDTGSWPALNAQCIIASTATKPTDAGRWMYPRASDLASPEVQHSQRFFES